MHAPGRGAQTPTPPQSPAALAQYWAFVTPSAPVTDAQTRMLTLSAPDFELPDLAGHMHRLSDHRGKKVFLLAWASW